MRVLGFQFYLLQLFHSPLLELFALFCTLTPIMSEVWNESHSMQPANPLPEVDGVIQCDLKTTPVPTPVEGSTTGIMVIICNKDGTILHLLDYDVRKLSNGNYRPTYKASKSSIGYGYRGNAASLWEAIMDSNGPVNKSLYGVFNTYKCHFKQANMLYSIRGDTWGPALTIPLIFDADDATIAAFISDLNDAAAKKLEEVKGSQDTRDLMKARFRGPHWLPIDDLIATGSDESAVYNEDKLAVITHEETTYKLFDEAPMRKHLLPELKKLL